ncbi:hypothetical protein LAZ40_07120 [Cereibacter sphaeroides]|uniref:hypothetical protein n=1 Tax=Cereibacter sphaeroides TaxID=1063 RepID=UPI001F35C0B0|nr:hypothetical protein [Cereibacter sphaeroides]MCE6958819.1 hypothetical protein [Cereibacter sphaeroides]MCE6973307.1 hypothetical protein [Cereibacter sphaeroides]
MAAQRQTRRRDGLASNERIARLWRDMVEERHPDADLRFDEAVEGLLDAGKLPMTRIQTILSRIDPADVMEFMQALDEIAAKRMVGIVQGPEQVRDCDFELFGIPVIGRIDLMPDLVARPGFTRTLAGFVSATGWSLEGSAVMVHPQLLPPLAFAALDPQALRDVLFESLDTLTGEDAGSALLAQLSGYCDREGDGSGEVSAGVRFLVGARLVAADAIEPDAFYPEEDEDEAAERIEVAAGAWSEEMERLLGEESEVTFLPPVLWGELRAEVLISAFDQALSLSLRGSGLDPEAVDLEMFAAKVSKEPDGICVDVVLGEEPVLRFEIASAIMGHAIHDFVEALDARIPIARGEPGEDATPGPTLY